MNKVVGNLEFSEPKNDLDAVNLEYLNKKLDEIKALIMSLSTKFTDDKIKNNVKDVLRSLLNNI